MAVHRGSAAEGVAFGGGPASGISFAPKGGKKTKLLRPNGREAERAESEQRGGPLPVKTQLLRPNGDEAERAESELRGEAD